MRHWQWVVLTLISIKGSMQPHVLHVKLFNSLNSWQAFKWLAWHECLIIWAMKLTSHWSHSARYSTTNIWKQDLNKLKSIRGNLLSKNVCVYFLWRLLTRKGRAQDLWGWPRCGPQRDCESSCHLLQHKHRDIHEMREEKVINAV